jgi:hypothetical protein
MLAECPLKIDGIAVALGTDAKFTMANWGKRGDSGVSHDMSSLALTHGNSFYKLSSRSAAGGLNATPAGSGSVWAAVGVKFRVIGVNPDDSDEDMMANLRLKGKYNYQLVTMAQGTSTVKLTMGLIEMVPGFQIQTVGPGIEIFPPVTLSLPLKSQESGYQPYVQKDDVRLKEGTDYIAFLRMECLADATIGDAGAKLYADYTTLEIDF